MGKRTPWPDVGPGERELLRERVRRLRMSIGVTQPEFAARLCTSKNAVSDWERGDAVPWSRDLPKIARALNVSVDYLLTGREAPHIAAALERAIRARPGDAQLLASDEHSGQPAFALRNPFGAQDGVGESAPLRKLSVSA